MATFSCDDGYVLSGSSTSVCQVGGLWSEEPPTCEPGTCIPSIKTVVINHSIVIVECDALSDPVNGTVRVTGTGVGDTATYTCDEGYGLSGNRIRTCQSTGEWSGSPPTCEGIPRILIMIHFFII